MTAFIRRGRTDHEPRRLFATAVLGLTVVSAALALSVGWLAERAPARTRPDGVRLMQLNICGHACNHDRPLAAVADALADYRPDAAGLDEVCRSQLDAIVAGLRRRDWPMAARFLVTNATACGGEGYGVAVLTRSRALDDDAVTYAEQAPGTRERRGLLCVESALGGRPTRVCATHLVSAAEDPSRRVRRGQVAAAARLSEASSMPVVLMGDFNLPPDDPAMAALYTPAHAGGTGEYAEVDQGRDPCRCGSPTHSSGAKLDYVFVTARGFAVRGAEVVDVASSDHDALRGLVSAR